MSCQLAIFDLDGTILNTLDDLANGVNYALKVNNLPTHEVMVIRTFLGNGMRNLISRSVPEGASEELYEKVYSTFVKYYGEHCSDNTKPYDGIKALLDDLHKHGCKTALVSNKGDFAVQKLMKQYFPDSFSIAVGERESQGIRRKPAPDTVNAVLKELGVKREDAVYIGDSEVDLETANNANMRHILVTWGFRDKDFLEELGAKVIVDTVQELEQEILQ